MTAPADAIDPEEELGSWRAEEAAARPTTDSSLRGLTRPGHRAQRIADIPNAARRRDTALPMQVLTKAKLQAAVAEHVTAHANKLERVKTFFQSPFVNYAA